MVLEDLYPGSELLETEAVEAALALAEEQPDLDLALLDMHLPGMDGRAGLRRLRAAQPALPVVMVSGEESSLEIRAALDDGASGYIPKASSEQEMRAALQLVMSGGVYVPQAALAAAPVQDADESRSARRRERADLLTPRQLEVLSLIARGLTNREICSVLSIAEGTVKAHLAAIFEALDVTNRTEAAVMARELGLKLPDEE